MKKLAVLIAAGAMTFTLAACSGNYAMHTIDGRTIVAQGKPVVDDATGIISYKGVNGSRQHINHAMVKEMVELGQ